MGEPVRPLVEVPRPPSMTPGALQARAETETYLRARRVLGARSVQRGLILLALLTLVLSLVRAGADRAFYAGWWRQW